MAVLMMAKRVTVGELEEQVKRLRAEVEELRGGNSERTPEEKLDLRIKVALVLLFGVMLVSMMLFIATGAASQ